VWFFRHAQSVFNAEKDYKADSFSAPLAPLSELGTKQAEHIANNFGSAPDLIITSPYVRAKVTAKFLILKYPTTLQEEWPIQEFSYLSSEKCSDVKRKDLTPFVDAYWSNNDPFYSDGPDAESFESFTDRVYETIKKIKNRKENLIVVFGHEIFITAIKYILENKPKRITPKAMQEFRKYFILNRIPNASAIKITL